MADVNGYPLVIAVGETSLGEFVPVQVDATGRVVTTGGSPANPFDQDLNTDDAVTFATATVTGTATANHVVATTDLATKTVKLTGVAFGSLPAGVAGMVAYVTDSNTVTWGATVAGGGANKVLVFYNGTNWTVVGK